MSAAYAETHDGAPCGSAGMSGTRGSALPETAPDNCCRAPGPAEWVTHIEPPSSVHELHRESRTHHKQQSDRLPAADVSMLSGDGNVLKSVLSSSGHPYEMSCSHFVESHGEPWITLQAEAQVPCESSPM